MSGVLTWAIPIGAAAFVLGWLITDVPLRSGPPEPEQTDDREPALAAVD